VTAPSDPEVGELWAVDAQGCDPEILRDRTQLAVLFDTLVQQLGLHPVAPPQWHAFPAPGGVTGALILGESHLTVHTFPEHESACLDLFTCVPRGGADQVLRLVVRDALRAAAVDIRAQVRAIAPARAARA
jgi:S-adenosylmethionine decarboxylase